MEIWFLSALGGAVLAGVSNFYFKQAAARGYNAELFSLFGGVLSVIGVGLVVLWLKEPIFTYGIVASVAFLGGFIAGTTNVCKVLALRFIDSTIYFPLFKLVTPTLTIIVGIIVFGESFGRMEWAGMILGITVPLLLINKVENFRQQNLTYGLALVLLTGIFSAASASLNKFATDSAMTVLAVLIFTSLGVFVGALALMWYRRGIKNIISIVRKDFSRGLFTGAFLRSLLITLSLAFTLTAYATGGPLAIVQTIHSMYILIPVVMAIWIYGEHWNLQKAVAIILSVAALALLG